ncbi:hypothetical protein J4760_10600 [Salinicoccus sp. ID82-1]|uniref:YkvI family membrane protein n=1 Tax=Salinicoccus sp. ID82-1 TaxID=2820269 RepID=UPI001F20D020|nr:hypothetical protein [Salinicoccus sp. ID82-1]MCG1010469.1 hypothetical protein [Salinicoccus sp. ID82-1]
MRRALKIGFAYTGVVVGAGFSTGQEILQFFTNNGTMSIFAILLSGLLVLFTGKWTADVGFDIKAESHVDSLLSMFGNIFGRIVDVVLAFFLYGVAVIMFAGAGSTFYESFGVAPWVGSLILIIAVYITLNLDFNRIVLALGAITPYLLAIVVIIAFINFMSPAVPFGEADQYAEPEATPLGPWWWDAITYSGFTIAVAFSFLTMMGSRSDSRKVAGWGGIIGSVVIILLMFLINNGLLARMNEVNDVELPMLLLADEIHPVLGLLLSIAMLLVIYNTAVGMLYPFLNRFSRPGSRRYKIMLPVSLILGYILSFAGFADLVGTVYPVMGYVGLLLGIAMFIKWLRLVIGKKSPH